MNTALAMLSTAAFLGLCFAVFLHFWQKHHPTKR